MKKELPFSVPEGYFESFASRLQERLENEHKPGFFLRTYRIWKPQLAVAAAITVLILMGYTIVRLSLSNTRQSESVEEIAIMIDYYIYDFDDETVITVFTDETDLNYLNNTFEADAIMNYLSEEDNMNDAELQNLY